MSHVGKPVRRLRLAELAPLEALVGRPAGGEWELLLWTPGGPMPTPIVAGRAIYEARSRR